MSVREPALYSTPERYVDECTLREFFLSAIERGDVEALDGALARFGPVTGYVYTRLLEQTLQKPTLDAYEWLASSPHCPAELKDASGGYRYDTFGINHMINMRGVENASEQGLLASMKQLRERGSPWWAKDDNYDGAILSDVLDAGYMQAAEWMVGNGYIDVEQHDGWHSLYHALQSPEHPKRVAVLEFLESVKVVPRLATFTGLRSDDGYDPKGYGNCGIDGDVAPEAIAWMERRHADWFVWAKVRKRVERGREERDAERYSPCASPSLRRPQWRDE